MNLALEEYLLSHDDQNYFMIWQSDPAVVVGKHQNALAEVNYRFIRENNIVLARRLSGGGTVFHDRGNLNFTYIARGEPGKLVDFRRYIEPVIDFLNTMGINATQGLTNEILVDGKKISGNAEHVHKNRVLHHGTLLLQADLKLLHESIAVVPGKYVDRAVQSRRSQVANLADFLPEARDPEKIGAKFISYIRNRFNGTVFQPDVLTLEATAELAELKYRSLEWTIGWSPDYEFRNVFRNPAFNLEIYIKVQRGVIVSASLDSAQITGNRLRRLEDDLAGCRHEAGHIQVVLEKAGFALEMGFSSLPELVYGFF